MQEIASIEKMITKMTVPSNIIPRDRYVNRVKPYTRKNLIKVLTGQRRVGKSYLLLKLIQLIQEDEADPNIIYINKEELEFDFIKDAKSLNDYVLKQIKDYWGGMLDLGATSFWEEYNPDKVGSEHYAMYGRPFGKSLCHAWGASPIYLLGKYYLGVKPLSPGYETYVVEPSLGGLDWMEGKVPTPSGEIALYCSKKEIRVKSDEGTGVLRFKSTTIPTVKGGRAEEVGKRTFEVKLEKGRDYTIGYTK